jgi:hypothetical protein
MQIVLQLSKAILWSSAACCLHLVRSCANWLGLPSNGRQIWPLRPAGLCCTCAWTMLLQLLAASRLRSSKAGDWLSTLLQLGKYDGGHWGIRCLQPPPLGHWRALVLLRVLRGAGRHRGGMHLGCCGGRCRQVREARGADELREARAGVGEAL